jgi:hypothetical protein
VSDERPVYSTVRCVGGHNRLDGVSTRSCEFRHVCVVASAASSTSNQQQAEAEADGGSSSWAHDLLSSLLSAVEPAPEPAASAGAGSGEGLASDATAPLPVIEFYQDPALPAPPLVFDDNALLTTHFPPAYVQLGVYPHTGVWAPALVRAPRPTHRHVQYSRAPVAVLMALFEERNWGHFLVDGLHALYYLQLLHHHTPSTDLQLILSRVYAPGLKGPAHALRRHFFPAVTRYAVQTLHELSRSIEPPQRLCFERLLVGLGGLSIQQFGEGVAISAERWRDFVRHNLGLPQFCTASSAARSAWSSASGSTCAEPLTTHQVLLFHKSQAASKRGRHWLNHSQLLTALRTHYFPGLNIVEFTPEQWSVADQLQLAARTSVWLSPPGGGSFLATFLPPGASAVFGDVWGELPRFDAGVAGALPPEKKSRRYAAEDRWWTHFSSLSIFHYPVCSRAETVVPEGAEVGEDYVDIVVNIERMANVLSLALVAAEQRIPSLKPFAAAMQRAKGVDGSRICA